MNVTPIAEQPQRVFVVIMEEGEEVAAGLDAFARRMDIDAASFTAVGGVRAATLGFFDLEIHDYRPIKVEEQSEVVSFLGDITRAHDDESKPKVHAHLVVAGSHGRTTGGHLLEAWVRPTFELVVTESPAHLRRTYEPDRGLSLIDLERSSAAGPTISIDLDAA